MQNYQNRLYFGRIQGFVWIGGGGGTYWWAIGQSSISGPKTFNVGGLGGGEGHGLVAPPPWIRLWNHVNSAVAQQKFKTQNIATLNLNT